MTALENRLHTAAELLELATEELMRRAPDRPMMFRFADGTAGSVESDRWRRESAGQTAMLALCRMLEAGQIVPRGPFGTPTMIDIMPDTVQRSCALDRADAELYLAALGIVVEDAQQAEAVAPIPAQPTTEALPARQNTEPSRPKPYATTKRIAEAFPPPKGTKPENWNKTLGDCPKWISTARESAGKRGVSALWNPAQFALCMLSEGHIGKGQAAAIIRREFPEWLDEWQHLVELSG